MRKYNDICQCCATDICNVRWNIIRHEFDKLALKEEDRCVALEFVQDLLESLTNDIEQRRGGMPLTSKQKEDDLKAAHDALVTTNANKYDDDDDGDDDGNNVVNSNNSKNNKSAAGAGANAVRKNSTTDTRRRSSVKEGDMTLAKTNDDEFDVLKTRVTFKLFEKWYLSYFVVDEIEEV